MITPPAPPWASARPAFLDSETARERLDRIMDAYRVEGPCPSYHRAQVARLAREWPTLYRALEAGDAR